jgi:hypothetical protein
VEEVVPALDVSFSNYVLRNVADTVIDIPANLFVLPLLAAADFRKPLALAE